MKHAPCGGELTLGKPIAAYVILLSQNEEQHVCEYADPINYLLTYGMYGVWDYKGQHGQGLL